MNRFSPIPTVMIILVLLATASLGTYLYPAGQPQPIPTKIPPRPQPPHVTPHPIQTHPIITRNLTLTRYAADATVRGSTANTKISLDFRNDTGGTVEGEFVFPVPAGAVVTDFALRDGDKRLEPELLEANEARQWYQEIVAKQIDPGLLEYVDQSAYRIHAFPFQPDQQRTIELTFVQQLPLNGNLHTYRLPLQFALPDVRLIRNLQAQQQLQARPAAYQEWALPDPVFVATVNIENAQGVGSITSPTHEISVVRADEKTARLGLETALTGSTRDFTLLLGKGSDEFSFNLLTYPGQGSEDGYFTATIYPTRRKNSRPLAKDITMVLDTSGSMKGEKFDQAQSALLHVVNNLNPEDRLALIDYDDIVNVAWDGHLPAHDGTRQQARNYINRLSVDGGTNIDAALTRAAQMITAGQDNNRPDYLLFFTDGLPTVGNTSVSTILDHLQANLPAKTRVFAFGVGNDVNTMLLDQMSLNHGGATDYVTTGERIDDTVAKFYGRIQDPALMDVQLNWQGLDVYDVFPPVLPDLYHGTELHLAGRYRGTPAGNVRLTFKGRAETAQHTIGVSCPAVPAATNDFVPRLWANMRVASLMESVRLQGQSPELMEEIRSLAQRYGIVTPYTSFLVKEEFAFDPAAQANQLARQQWDANTGAGAVRGSESIIARKGYTTYDSTSRDTYKYGAEDSASAPPENRLNRRSLGAAGSLSSGADKDIFYAPSPSPEEQAREFAAAVAEVPEALPLESLVMEGNLTFLQMGTGLVDSRYDLTSDAKVVQITAFGDRYFEAINATPGLAKFLSLSGELTLVLGPDLVLQTVMVDAAGKLHEQSMVHVLHQQPGSQAPATFTDASGDDWDAVLKALETGYFRG